MKKTLVLLAALAFTSAGTAFAQTAVKTTGSDANQTALHQQLGKGKKAKTPKTPEQKADKKAAKMAKELGLNADQEARLEKLMLTRQQEATALKAKYGADKKAGRAEMKAAHDRYETELKTILTPEQYTKMTQLKAEHHNHGQHKGGEKVKVKTKA